MRDANDIINDLIEKRDVIRDWIVEAPTNASIDQRHLVANSSECTYWHHGYQAALDDVIRQLIVTYSKDCTSGKPN